ncbi:hypothetical protein M409DRAFT_16457 [Zasmidium cellare ATCC 36951]|uniref:DUF1772 domain-containing protein n=1 Tax=Zasmidium cellare ATCC 36951 TaxID=1080233 RepID=A0A6A6D959_ZASCE|nr:uncharacterized protein M409DRAFT_16457 [Zasmidium cellare ATCC 36951]KAF2174186.1 hypothetical protein M409DRAFT_16457 [Zasmidium cellare ATCC 36951]
MSERTQQLVSVAQLLGLSGASALSAYIASFSLIGIPACQMAPIDLQAKQWSRIYHIGKDSVPPFAIALSGSFAFLAYHFRHAQGRFPIPPVVLYSLAAVLPPSVVGFTFTVMWNGVQALEAKAAGNADAPSEAETKSLVAKWKVQNYVRSAIVGSAAVLGAVALLS